MFISVKIKKTGFFQKSSIEEVKNCLQDTGIIISKGSGVIFRNYADPDPQHWLEKFSFRISDL